MECFTGRENHSTVAIKLNEISYVEILSLSQISTQEALRKPGQILDPTGLTPIPCHC